jgi:hypothetical protein
MSIASIAPNASTLYVRVRINFMAS